MIGNNRKALDNAKKVKNDEYYTRLVDIEEELQYYDFKGKKIFLNCDTEKSNFFRYFVDNFKELGIKFVVAIGKNLNGQDYCIGYNGKEYKKKTVNNGDFQGACSLAILKVCDVVITNPPFSVLRPYIKTILESGKEFLFLANNTAIGYKEIFPYFQEQKMWLGKRKLNRDMYFHIPEATAKDFIDNYKEGSKYKIIDGEIMGRIATCCWFTNMLPNSEAKVLEFTCEYSIEKYPKFDNKEAINVGKVAEIPKKFMGIMGVPLTFMEYFTPMNDNGFEIVGFRKGDDRKDLRINGKDVFSRVLIQRKRK